MNELELTAVNGINPMGWLAALGTLVALDQTAPREAAGIRLRWQYAGKWTPILSPALGPRALLERLRLDLERIQREPAFMDLQYRKGGKESLPLQRDLKPPPGFFRDYLRRMLDADAGRASLDLAAALATDVAVDGNGNTKPTALYFTAGQQQFLNVADELADALKDEDLSEALLAGWSYRREEKTFGWDAGMYRDYALRADDPSKAAKGTVPGADWLAFRGLTCLPCSPRGESILTRLCTGRGNHVQMHWPLWTPALTLHEIRSLLARADLVRMTRAERQARGVADVFTSKIVRSDQGYGAFAPPALLQPAAQSGG